MQTRKNYTATTVGASSVTLTQQAGFESITEGGAILLGTGTVVITTTGTPDASFWKSGYKYIVEVTRVS